MKRRQLIASVLTGALPRAGHPQFVQPASRPYPGTFDIGSRKELFVDDVLIEEMASLSKVVTRPEKFIDNPVLRPDRPWEPQLGEKNAYGIGAAGQAVLYDAEERLFKIWYLCSGPPGRSFWCYATSPDGLRWEKPNLGIFDYQGSKKNNIAGVYGDPQYFNFFKDPNESDPRKRYKAMGEWENSPTANTHGGAYVGYSADGLRWTPYEGNPVIKHGPNLGDAPTMLGWDPLRRKYVCYPRPGHPMAPEIRGAGFHRHIRSLGYSESDDFLHWTPTVPMLMPDRGDRVDFQYERFLAGVRGHFYFGLIPMRQSFDRTFEIYALTSRDGFHWNWIDRHRPFIERGEVGAYDGGGITCSGPIFHDNRVWIYYNGTRYKHRQSINNRPGPNDQTTISLAMLPLDRFMALVAGPHVGTLLTRPVQFSGSRLTIDMEGSVPVDLNRAEAGPPKQRKRSFDDAEVRVALFDQSGGPIEGFSLDRCEPLFESGVQTVIWTGADLSRLAGKLVRLRFEVRNAGLYSFQFS
ncbi:MAG: hypothetical protein ACKV22_06740 [Bryobacteraceae bacterium]